MASPRDPVDDWLERQVTPLSPPPGALDRIRHRARRRKVRQVTVAAAGCAVVLAAAVVTPQLLPSGQHSGQRPNPPAAAGSSPPAATSGGANTPTPDTGSNTPLQQGSVLSATTSGAAVPPNFQPTSVTFVGTGNNSVVGAVIGQAGTPGHCATADCTSLAGTSDYGTSWYGVSAPVAPGPDGSAGVSQLRFANLSDGWAYGPALYQTSTGGWPWTREDTGGHRVLDVEAAPARATSSGAVIPARAYAVFGTCTGTGADYAATCSSYSLWTSAAGSTTWSAVAVPAAYQQLPAGSAGAPLLVISGGTTGYLLTPSGEVLSGPTTGSGWHPVRPAPCSPGASPAGAQLAAGPKLVLACDAAGGGGRSAVTVYTSAGGTAWQRAGTVTVGGTVTSLASAVTGQAVLATTAGIEYSADGGTSWRAARFGGAAPPGGFSYVGMTDATQGVAVPANAALGAVWVTSNGGRTWHRSPVSS